jgi:hypothetical protein
VQTFAEKRYRAAERVFLKRLRRLYDNPYRQEEIVKLHRRAMKARAA